ncbi:FecCD family ABC transporter permease [Nakamurella endophytica]|uniref:Iron ABC transporter permease n=1 Tax=Nakamurella endophytica TaxID=1748367 RepID=A0A917SV69_9ACTN|nr:iron ABC transporter permease [Nakamurella endophytica]GGL97972.1 iron ABC transporter permease [Nakamurella endophytica]
MTAAPIRPVGPAGPVGTPGRRHRLPPPARRPRALAATAGLAALLTGLAVWSLSVGESPVAWADIVPALTGHGDAGAVFAVRDLRAPRALCAVVVGAALGVSGAIFQSLTRNPLASPDLLGISGGASTAVAVAVLGLGLTDVAAGPLALVGAAGAAAFLYLFAWRRGVSGQRLILVGIGVAALTTAVTSYLLTIRPALQTQRVLFFLTGSVSGADWGDVAVATVTVVLLLAATPLLLRWMPLLELDDSTAAAVGVPVQRARFASVCVAALLAALAVSIAGPLSFVGLIAAPLGRAVTGRPGFALLPAALCGALAVLIADLAGRTLFGEIDVPVGVLTALAGAPYLLAVLLRSRTPRPLRSRGIR